MKQEVDVMVIFEKGKREPRPIRFKTIENGIRLTVDVADVLNMEYIGMNRIDYVCNAMSSRGNLVNLNFQYYRNEGRWVLET